MPATGKSNCSILLVVYCGPAMVLCLMLVSAPAVSGSFNQDDAFTQRRAHYCGTKLSNTLAKLCTNFNGLRKKSDSFMMPYHGEDIIHDPQMLDNVQHDVEELRLLHDRSTDVIYQALMSLQHLNTRSPGLHRVRRQVVKECCVQSCTLETLQTYCAN